MFSKRTEGNSFQHTERVWLHPEPERLLRRARHRAVRLRGAAVWAMWVGGNGSGRSGGYSTYPLGSADLRRLSARKVHTNKSKKGRKELSVSCQPEFSEEWSRIPGLRSTAPHREPRWMLTQQGCLDASNTHPVLLPTLSRFPSLQTTGLFLHVKNTILLHLNSCVAFWKWTFLG